MKIAVIGGGGVRTPLLVSGLTRSDLPLREIALHDTDRGRLRLMAPLAAQVVASARASAAGAGCSRPAAAITSHDDVEACVANADFVFTSIRVGGAAQRARDERIALEHGLVGQETVGAAGFAMAMRTIPAIVDYGRRIAARASDAWIINFTNPVGMVTEALHRAGCVRAIGICDTPTELFEEVAHALGVPSRACAFDYTGLNHLGWLREVFVRGRPQLASLWEDAAALQAIHRSPLVTAEALRLLRLIPTEYVAYYDRPEIIVRNIVHAGESRGAAVLRLTEELLADLGGGVADPVARYERYLEARNASYMQIESGTEARRAPSPWAELTGYDKIALSVVRAIHFDSGTIIPLNVVNRGAITDLDDDDIVEVPCVVTSNGARPLATGAAPSQVRSLLLSVRRYERATVRAAISRDREEALDALASNPLVPDRGTAAALLEAFGLP